VASGGGCRHGGGVGCGAALPVVFLAKPSGRTAGLTLGGVVLTVNGDGAVVERPAGGRGAGLPVVWRGAGRVGACPAAAGADGGRAGCGAGPAQVTVPRMRGDACAAAGVVPVTAGR